MDVTIGVEITKVNPFPSIRGVTALDDVVWEATARYRFRAVMVTSFAPALVLAMVGVFGILAYIGPVAGAGLRGAAGAPS